MTPSEAERLSGVVAAIGSAALGPALDDFARTMVAFDMTCVFAYHPQTRPIVVHDGYSGSVSREALESYVRGGYLLDPFYAASIGGAAPGVWRMGDLAPDEFFASDFAGSSDVHPCISDRAGALVEEVGFVVELPGGWGATYSLMRNRASSVFDPREFAALATSAPIVAAVLSRHWDLTGGATAAGTTDNSVESALQRAFAGPLTPSQFRVVELVLRGHSTASIAAELGITEGTAKLHRHNAYGRLGVSGQSELFRRFLDELSQMGPRVE